MIRQRVKSLFSLVANHIIGLIQLVSSFLLQFENFSIKWREIETLNCDLLFKPHDKAFLNQSFNLSIQKLVCKLPIRNSLGFGGLIHFEIHFIQ